MNRIKLSMIFFFVLFAIHVNGQENNNDGYFITGIIKGIDSGIVRMLSGNGNSVLDSSIIKKGKFSMKGKIGSPQRLLFNVSPGNWNFRAFVENTGITVYIDTAGADHYGKGNDKWALIWEIEEQGSELANVYTKYKNETNQQYYTSVFGTLRNKLKEVRDNVDATSKVNRNIDSVRNLFLLLQKDWIENYITQNPSSIAGVYLFHEYYQSSSDRSLSNLDSMLSRFSGLATSSVYYAELATTAANLRNTQTNSLAPDFTLLQRDKTSFTLSSTRGNYTLIDFWASWCVPCRKAIPLWKEMYTKYKHKGFIILGVSNDRNWDDWIKALDKEQMPWIQVIDEFPVENEPALVASLYPSDGIPFYVLLDKDGKVIIACNDKDAIRKKIEEILR